MGSEQTLFVARREALKALSRKALSRWELRSKLLEKGIAEEIVDVVVTEFAQKRILDDKGLAEDVIERAQKRKFEGRRLVKRRLKEKGIDPEVIESELASEYTTEMEFSAALAFAEGRRRNLSSYPPEVQFRRIAAALDRRGFPLGIILDVLKKLKLDSENSIAETE